MIPYGNGVHILVKKRRLKIRCLRAIVYAAA